MPTSGTGGGGGGPTTKVSPTTALLACLSSEAAGMTPAIDGKLVSSLLFEGRTPRTRSSFDAHVKTGLKIINKTRPTTTVVVKDSPDFLLDKDQTRKVFETEFAFDYLKHQAFADVSAPGAPSLTNFLGLLERELYELGHMGSG